MKAFILKTSHFFFLFPGGGLDCKCEMWILCFIISWGKKGRFNFKDQRLEDIMKILSRWYDMNVVYENEGLKNIRFGCNLNRYEKITPFVKLLEKTKKCM